MLFPIKVFKVRDRSMEPELKPDDYLIVNRWFKELKVGDIVVLRHPKGSINIVKRVSTISSRKIFVVGDNKKESEDSRAFGSVDRKSIIGKLIVRI